MSFVAPLKIEILSDGNIIELTGHSKKTGMYSYRYTKSETKLGKDVSFSEDNLKKIILINQKTKKQ